MTAWLSKLDPNELAILIVVLPAMTAGLGWVCSTWIQARRERRGARAQQRTWLKEALAKYVAHANSYWLTEGASTEHLRKDVVGATGEGAYLAHRLPRWFEGAPRDAKEAGLHAFAAMRESGEGGSFGDCEDGARPDLARALQVSQNAGALRAAIDEV